MEKGSYELLEETLKNTMEELKDVKTKLRQVESEKYNLSLDIMKLELEIKLNSNSQVLKQTDSLADLKANHDQMQEVYNNNSEKL